MVHFKASTAVFSTCRTLCFDAMLSTTSLTWLRSRYVGRAWMELQLSGWFEALVYELSVTVLPVAFLVLRLLEMYESA